MNNIEQNALRIAELTHTFMYDGLIKQQSMNRAKAEEISCITKFSSYNGLMPLVFECNKSNLKLMILIRDYDIVFHEFKTNNRALLDYRTEPEFIEAIQLAVIKYLELKNEH